MWRALNQFSRSRASWLLLLLCVVGLEATALYFQHGQGLAPCVMCIYERVALFGVGTAALLGLIAPEEPFWRTLGLLAYGITAAWGLKLSLEHVSYQFPDPNQLFGPTCDVAVNFPSWTPLNQWLPQVFEASGDCSKVVWQWLGWSMPQWLVGIFSAMLVIWGLVVIVQFIGRPPRRIFS